MCLELLLEIADSGRAEGALADWGTGSGILAVTGARLGFEPVIACDYERAALKAAGLTARANGVRLELARVDLRRQPPPTAGTVTANLTAPLLQEVAERLERPPARLLASGMLVGEAGEVADAFAGTGLRERDRRRCGDWAALLLEAAP
jgi:ribosomal protein L11 methyltransferase